MKHKQYCDAAFIAIGAVTNACVALHDEVTVSEGAQIVKAAQIGQNLAAQTIRQS